VKLTIPELALVALVGASGAGKSTFARAHFRPTEVLSSDHCRALVSDDENSLDATTDAFAVLHFIAGKRLARGKLVVVDATNVQPEARKPLVALAREHHCIPVAIVLDMPERLCHERNAARPDRSFGPHVVRNHVQQLRRSLKALGREGFRHVYVLSSPEEIAAAEIAREPLRNNLSHDHGPFDVIGDVHGCREELVDLLGTLGYAVTAEGARHPEGRKLVFLGDLVDRGPDTPGVLELVMATVARGDALCLPGNHDVKLMRKLKGRDVQVTHGLAESLAQLDAASPELRDKAADFVDRLVSHYVLDDGKLVVAHAGMKAEMQGRGSGRVRDFALYGETTGETDAFGLPVRHNWAAEYRGAAHVVYGHTPVPEPEWLNRTINVDTGCVFGGRLTALRWPEKELVSVSARRTYAEPSRPFLPEGDAAPAVAVEPRDDLLDLDDVLGKRVVETGLMGRVTVREENATAALEAMSRFATDPHWLVYLPPTMSPSETSQLPGLLEHPAEAFAYYRTQGVPRVLCEQKHMGSRAVVLLCRDADAARRRFGAPTHRPGVVYTRTGRRFFDDAALERALVDRVRAAFDASGLWDELSTDWAVLDCELMPWSAKAQELLRQQYAAVGAAARAALAEALPALAQGIARGLDLGELELRHRGRLEMAGQFVEAYGRYCWPVASIADLKLAPFHLLATEGHVHADRDHLWHMATLARLCAADPALLLATPHLVVDTTDAASQEAGARWWAELTAAGGEGMVVKPLDFVVKGKRAGLVQPAIKCRGREYLRIIYGPEYTAPEHLERLRQRGLGAKRALAQREFALGLEGLERFVRREPLYRVHECAFAVLALESEPVDPRL
jgi:protein phosphatase